jgi:hypothetical protein
VTTTQIFAPVQPPTAKGKSAALREIAVSMSRKYRHCGRNPYLSVIYDPPAAISSYSFYRTTFE